MITWVSASAGTGKTYNLVRKIKDLILSGSSGYEILCISFSNTAANEMKNRLQDVSSTVNCHTIHSFCNTFFKNKRIIDSKESEDMIKQIINDFLKQDIWFDAISLLINEWPDIISKVIEIVNKNYKVSDTVLSKDTFKWNKIEIPNYIIEAIQQGDSLEKKLMAIKSDNITEIFEVLITKDGSLRKRLYSVKWAKKFPDEKLWINEFCENMYDVFHNYREFHSSLRSNLITKFAYQVKEKYKKEKSTNDLLDFNDLLNQVNFDNLSNIMKIKHIFVDEAQDLSKAQWDIVIRLFKEIYFSVGCDLYIVGDEKQGIYSFQNSDDDLFFKTYKDLKLFSDDYNAEFEHIDLKKSYRTSYVILNFVDKIMSSTKYPTIHESAVSFSGRVEVNISPLDNISNLIDKVKFLLGGCYLFEIKKLIEERDILILIKRRNKSSFQLIQKLKEAGIKIQENPFNLIQDEFIQDLINVSKYVLFNDEIALASLLKGSFFCWQYYDLENFFTEGVQSYNEKHKNLLEFIELCRSYPKDIIGFYSNLIFHNNYGDYMIKTSYDSILYFWELINKFQGFSWFEFFNYIDGLRSNIKNNEDGIRIKTIHSSKGLESPIVMIFDNNKHEYQSDILIENGMILFPDKSNLEYKNIYNENKDKSQDKSTRLMYVALTRAREQLYIFTVSNDFAQILKNAYKNDYINLGAELTKNMKKLL